MLERQGLLRPPTHGASHGSGGDGGNSASSTGLEPPVAAGPDSAMAALDQIAALDQMVDKVLRRTSMVVFELQDGIALQKTYDMLAQRERALNQMFAGVPGRAMSDVDLVRNHILDQIGGDDERMDAYEGLWLPMERAQGDGDPAALEAFMRRWLERAEQQAAAQPASGAGTATDDAAAAGAGVAASLGPSALSMGPLPPSSSPLLDRVAAQLAARGGSSSMPNLYAAGTPLADRARAVDGADAQRAAVELLTAMSADALCAHQTDAASEAPRGLVTTEQDESVVCIRDPG